MSYFLPEGSKLFISSGLATAVTVSGITNANPAVASATAHGYANSDPLVLFSGWEDADATVFQAAGVAANTFQLQGFDTTDTTWFTSGGGAGSAQKVTGWTELTQWLTVDASGGDQRTTTVDPISRRNSLIFPAGFNPTQFSLGFGYDTNLASQQAMIAASRGLKARAFKMAISGGMTGYFYGNISFNEIPKISKGSVLTAAATVSVLGRFISY